MSCLMGTDEEMGTSERDETSSSTSGFPTGSPEQHAVRLGRSEREREKDEGVELPFAACRIRPPCCGTRLTQPLSHFILDAPPPAAARHGDAVAGSFRVSTLRRHGNAPFKSPLGAFERAFSFIFFPLFPGPGARLSATRPGTVDPRSGARSVRSAMRMPFIYLSTADVPSWCSNVLYTAILRRIFPRFQRESPFDRFAFGGDARL